MSDDDNDTEMEGGSDSAGDLDARASEVFDRALDIDGVDERAAFLEDACGADTALRREVDSLLAALDDASAFLETPITEAAHGQAVAMVGKRVSGYLIERVIAVGGMGAVYLARQENPSREVALKLIKPGLYSRRVLRRFEHEGDLLGRLQHPGIAQIFEAGRTDADGAQPFLAMEYIEGQGLIEYVATHDLGTRERLELMARICDATHHAHQKGIIHRDLKPANILVDSYGNPKIVDFGIARFTDADIDTVTRRTDVGELIGTVPYMSPEQVAGDPDELDTRSDVYSLGVLLYEVLAGNLPYDVRRKSVLEAVRIIRDEDPTPLSAFGTVFRGDLETIVAKALEKEKARRYGSASDLAADMRHYLQDEPIVARPPSASYQLRKFARRHRGIVIGSMIALAVLLAGVVTTTLAWLEASEARELESLERAEAVKARNLEVAARKEEQRQRQVAERAREAADEAREEESRQRRAADEAREEESRQRRAADLARDEAAREAATAAAINSFMIKVLAQSNPWLRSPYSAPARDVTLVEVLDRASEEVADELGDQPVAEAGVRNTIGVMYCNLGRLRDAEVQLRRALELRTGLLGAEHLDTALTVHWLGSVHRRLGNLEDSEVFLRRAVELRSKLLGPAAPPTLESRTVLSGTLIELTRYDEAEKELDEVLRICEESGVGLETEYIANYVLSGLHSLRGDLGAAEMRTRRALEITEAAHGRGHVRTLIPRFQLGHLQKFDYEKRVEAERNIRAAVDGAREALGETHPQALFFMRSYASLLDSMGGRGREAERMLRHVVTEYRRQLGVDHIDTIDSMTTLGNILGKKGNRDEARELLTLAAERSRAVLGSDNRVTATAVMQLANFEREGGNVEAAVPLLREAIELNRATRGADSLFTAFALRNLGLLLLEEGNLDEAEARIREALEINTRVRGTDHPQTSENQVNLADILRKKGQTEEAEKLLLQALSLRERVLGSNHPGTLAALDNLARQYLEQGRDADAEKLLDRSYAGKQTALGELHPSTLITAGHLESLLRKQGRTAEVAALYRQILAAADSPEWRENPAVDRQEIASYRGGLGVCLVRLDRPAEAVPVLLESLRGLLGDDAERASPIEHPTAANVARTLVAAYEKLGDDERATKFRARLPVQ